jgi:hypothetical protein
MANHNLGAGTLSVQVSWELAQTVTGIVSTILSILAFLGVKPKRKPSPRRKQLSILYGTVTDELTGRPVEEIIVTCKGPKGIYCTVTTVEGSFRIENIAQGTYDVLLTDPQGRYRPKVI